MYIYRLQWYLHRLDDNTHSVTWSSLVFSSYGMFINSGINLVALFCIPSMSFLSLMSFGEPNNITEFWVGSYQNKKHIFQLFTILIFTWFTNRVSSRWVMAKVLDCGFVISEFELQSCYYIHFWIKALWKVMNSLIPLDMDLNSITAVIFIGLALVLNNPRKLICH